jgi:hypothetical protein
MLTITHRVKKQLKHIMATLPTSRSFCCLPFDSMGKCLSVRKSLHSQIRSIQVSCIITTVSLAISNPKVIALAISNSNLKVIGIKYKILRLICVVYGLNHLATNKIQKYRCMTVQKFDEMSSSFFLFTIPSSI